MVTRVIVSGGKSKVGELDGSALVGHQDIFRFQVAMVDSQGMAILDRIQDLEERMFGQVIIAVLAFVCDVREQVAFRTEFEDHKSAVGVGDDSQERDHVGMLAGPIVKGYLAFLYTSLSSIETEPGKSLHGVGDVGQDINGLVHNTKGANSKDRDKFQSSVEQPPKSIFRRKASCQLR